MISVIVPCYNETSNIRPLCKRLFDAIEDSFVELLIMDDESDGTEGTIKVVKELREEGYNIYVHTRRKEDGRGLSSAVLNGIKIATNDIIVVMDGDLQHEPESVPSLVKPVMLDGYNFCMGVRNTINFNWSLRRRLISIVATKLAYGLTDCIDPMSGFFCTRRSLVLENFEKINPIGFKIGLELMIKMDCNKITDRSINFRKREIGESKLSVVHYVLYLIQLFQLYIYKNRDNNLLKFLIYLVIVFFLIFF